MFEDKVAIVSGAGRGIGRATAELLAAGGARVVIGDVDEAAAREVEQAIGEERALAWAGDLTAEGAPAALVAAAVDRWDRLDIVVNNAGYTIDAPLHVMEDQDFQAMLEIHTLLPFRLLRAAATYMREPAKRERHQGVEVFRKVVNVASVAAYGNAGQANYAAAKAGVLGLTKTLAREWGPLKVNVNAVAFGFIETRLTAVKDAESVIAVGERRVHVGVPEQARQMLSQLVPLGRAGTVGEAAGAIAFLCSPWSDYVSGQVLNVSGGIPFAMGPA
jgi:3-oxoacyl-[acyl-carrier protein] reductase